MAYVCFIFWHAISQFYFTLIYLLCFQSKIPTVHYLTSTKQQTHTVSSQLVNTVEYLEAKETDMSLIMELHSSGVQKHDPK